MKNYPWYYPASSLTEEQSITLPLEVAERMPNSFLSVLESMGKCEPLFIPYVENLNFNEYQLSRITFLGELFCKNGSDKSTVHNYHWLYGAILSLYSNSPRILEIGVGSNNIEIPSNMGLNGTPGASLRSFRAISPYSVIDGADIDESISVEGFKIFHVDQLDPKSLNSLKEIAGGPYDLIIDDGMHSPDANLNTLRQALSMISEEGIIVIEDISPSALPIWVSLHYYFKETKFDSYIISTKATYLFIVSKNKKLSNLIPFN